MNEEIKITPVKIENGVAFRGAVSLTDDELKKRVDFMEKHTKELNKLVIKAESELYIKELLKRNKTLQEENQKLNKVIDELEKWLKETKKFNYGFKIKSEYIYVHEFVCKNILNKLTELKKEVE